MSRKRASIVGGRGLANQEVYNEVIATSLHRRLLDASDFVAYFLHKEGRRTYCACPNMLREDEELVPAWDIIKNRRKPNSQNDYQFLISCFESLGLEDVETYLSKMLLCDFIVSNFDRHYRNFGVIRNVETLEYTRFAPIFDTGNCLWCDKELLETAKDFAYIAKPFGQNGMKPERQLGLLSRFEWFRAEKLEGFAQEAADILAGNPNLPPARIERIRKGINRQIEKLVQHVEHHRSFQHTGQENK